MSMNLHCSEVPLVQTPTCITYMCLGPHDNPEKDWRAIRDRYIKWLESHWQGLQTPEKIERRINTAPHIEELMSQDHLTFCVV